jgi:hypothetical protein
MAKKPIASCEYSLATGTENTDTKSSSTASASDLTFHRHPISGAYYGAYDFNRVRLKSGDKWGEFDRDGNWREGQIRYADPQFCRWVTSEYAYNARLAAVNCTIWPQTRSYKKRKEAT